MVASSFCHDRKFALRHLGSLSENFLVNNCGMYCMIRSENDFKNPCVRVFSGRMRKSIFRTNHTYHNCLLESSHLENPSVLIGWWSRIGIPITLRMRFFVSNFQNKSYIHTLKLLSKLLVK